jgi:hypothetical protein
VAALALSGCGSLGGIFGGSGDTPSDTRDTRTTSRSDLRGTVVDVDTVARRITLEADRADARTSTLQPQRSERTMYYDERTVVEFAGESYRPESLERGDEVDVRYARHSDRDLAERIVVVRDVRAGGPASYDDDTLLRGTVGDVNTGDRMIELERTHGDRGTRVYYDERTVVAFEGREYKPENLERGDEISVTGERRNDRFLADRITVERDARVSSEGSYDDDVADREVRGTVRSLSTRDRLIQLDLAFGERGDERVYYDERTVVDLQGREVAPERLVVGDEISVRGTRRADNRFLADTIQVVREARSSE